MQKAYGGISVIQKSEFICSTEYNGLQMKVGIALLDVGILMIWQWIRLYGDDLTYWLAVLFFLEGLCQAIWTIQIFKNSNSYIRVYDDHVEGVTRVPFYGVNNENKAFSLQYNEILKAEILHSFIRIYTSSQNYEAMALENDNWALAEIRGRISTKN